MAYSLTLADRIRRHLPGRGGWSEKKMFGGLAFFLRGNMCVGVWQSALIARVGVEQAPQALQQPHARPFDVTGRPMQGWLLVEPDGVETDAALVEWLERAASFVQTLPAKS